MLIFIVEIEVKGFKSWCREKEIDVTSAVCRFMTKRDQIAENIPAGMVRGREFNFYYCQLDMKSQQQ